MCMEKSERERERKSLNFIHSYAKWNEKSTRAKQLVIEVEMCESRKNKERKTHKHIYTKIQWERAPITTMAMEDRNEAKRTCAPVTNGIVGKMMMMVMVMMMMMFYFAPRIFVVYISFNSAVHWALFLLLSFPNLFQQQHLCEQNNSLICLILISTFSFCFIFPTFNTLQILIYRIYIQICTELHRRWVCARVHIGLSILHVSCFSAFTFYNSYIDGFLFRSWPFKYMHTLLICLYTQKPHFIQFSFDELYAHLQR